jgi:uncharacterized protein YjbI with pentapeptide repeats
LADLLFADGQLFWALTRLFLEKIFDMKLTRRIWKQNRNFPKPVRKRVGFWTLIIGSLSLISLYNQVEIKKCLTSVDIDQCFFIGKTAWEWLELLIAPGLLAAVGIFAERYFKSRDDNKLSQERELTKDNKRQTTLKEYFEKMTELLLDEKWPEINESYNDKGRSIIAVARARTLAVLRELDADRKRSIIKFIVESGSINQISLASADLNSADLSYTGLSKANLSEANLNNANLRNTDLSEVNLSRADLDGADLSNTSLELANCSYANLRNTNLCNTDLNNAHLPYTNFSNANLSDANLSDANLRGADLSSANLGGANLSGVDLREANLRNSNLSKANLSNTNLIYSDLSCADLSEANLAEAKLIDNSIRYPELSAVKVDRANLTNAQGISDQQRAVLDQK